MKFCHHIQILLCVAAVSAFPVGASSQNTIGLPEILNYPKQVYNAGTQNWDMKQDAGGVMYFANNEGLLSFDGTYWSLYPLPNKTIVRSVMISKDNKIYVGGQDEIGFFSPDPSAKLVYTSLRNLIPEKDKTFTDIWDIIPMGNDIFFRSTTKLFQLSGGRIAVYRNDNWRFLGTSGHRLLAQSASNELLEFQNGLWNPFVHHSDLAGDYIITASLPWGADSTLLVTLKNGLYVLAGDRITKLSSPDIEEIAALRIYSAVIIDKQTVALATSLGGCFIIDKQGHLLQSFTRKEGLQNNNILNIFLDEDKNLWLGLDNGIDFIAYNDAVKHIYTDNLNPGSGYASVIYHNNLYIGTSNGLYTTPISGIQDLSYLKGNFQPVSNTNGQVWNLSVVNDHLLLGHHDGAFLVNGSNATLLQKGTGFWTFQPLYSILPSSVMVAGNYNGITLYNYAGDQFKKSGKGIDFESSRYVAIEDSTIWVGHPYMGIYRVQLNQNQPARVKLYTSKNGLPSDNNNCLYKVRNRVAITTEKGIYEFNPAKDNFEPSAYFNSIFGNINIRYLREDATGNIWFIADKKMGVADMSSGIARIMFFPELTNKMVSGFEYIDPVDNYNIFLGGENGFYHLNYEQYKKKTISLEVRIRTVKTISQKSQLLFGGYNEISQGSAKQPASKPEIGFNQNSLHFDYSSAQFRQRENIEFSTYLKGFDEGWSQWTKKTEKEYTNLPPGNYSFRVKSRNNTGNESAESIYAFTILPPWYRTYWAFTFYALACFVLAYFFYRRQQQKFARQQVQHEEEQKRLQYLHQLELEKTEKEIVKLKNEKLEAEIRHKNTELASVAMHLLQKGEMLSKIKDQLNRTKTNENETTGDLKKIGKMLNEEDRVDADWEMFAAHFDMVHSDFLATLKMQCPGLSPNELKLCAYLKMNLSTKEIAQLMNISTRGVEISRYRLRKKLQIPRDANLFSYLISITSRE